MRVTVCEYEFDLPDPVNPSYSAAELDFYSHIPYPKEQETGMPQHRLSLRKNLTTGQFEVYRAYAKSFIFSRQGLSAFQEEETGQTKVEFSSAKLAEALAFANRENNRFWASVFGGEERIDQECRHDGTYWMCGLRDKR